MLKREMKRRDRYLRRPELKLNDPLTEILELPPSLIKLGSCSYRSTAMRATSTPMPNSVKSRSRMCGAFAR